MPVLRQSMERGRFRIRLCLRAVQDQRAVCGHRCRSVGVVPIESGCAVTATRQSAPVPTQSLCACRAERSAGVRLIVCTRARTDYDDFDEMVNPVENFYEFAVGGWRKRNPIPPEYPSWNCFTILHDLNQKRLKEMVDELGVKADASGTEKKLADYWASAMDEAAIEAAGMAPLVPLLDAVSAEKIGSDLTGLTEVLAKLILWGVGATPFSFYESPDK